MIDIIRDDGELVVDAAGDDAWLAGTYLDRRMAIAWPTANADGYCTVFGVRDERGALGNFPLVQLDEYSTPTADRLREQVAAMSYKWGAEDGFARLSGGFEYHAKAMAKYLNRFGSKLHLFDLGESFKLSASVPILRDLIRRNLLRIKKNGILWRDIAAFQPEQLLSEDRVMPEELHPPHAALNHLVMSWQAFPFRRGQKRKRSI